jgi:hypothetical protein
MTTYVSGKWVPVPRSWVSPDGRRFAYVVNNPDPLVHVVTIASGSDQTIALEPLMSAAAGVSREPSTAKRVVAFATEGVYLETIFLNSDAQPTGLALLDPDPRVYKNHGGLLGVAAARPVALQDGLAFYVEQANSSSTTQSTGSELTAWMLNGVNVMGLPIESGVLYRADARLSLVGFDGQQEPMVSEESASAYTIVTWTGMTPQAPAGRVVLVFAGEAGDPDRPTGPGVADGSGVWFGSDSGIVWYYPGGGAPFEKVAVAGVHPVLVAGPCMR